MDKIRELKQWINSEMSHTDTNRVTFMKIQQVPTNKKLKFL